MMVEYGSFVIINTNLPVSNADTKICRENLSIQIFFENLYRQQNTNFGKISLINNEVNIIFNKIMLFLWPECRGMSNFQICILKIWTSVPVSLKTSKLFKPWRLTRDRRSSWYEVQKENLLYTSYSTVLEVVCLPIMYVIIMILSHEVAYTYVHSTSTYSTPVHYIRYITTW